MNTNATIISSKRWPHLGVWLPVLAGFMALFFPTICDLMTGLWSTEEYLHGPLIPAISVWLLIRKWSEMGEANAIYKGTLAGWVVLGIGLIFYIFGRSQGVLKFELVSFVFLTAGVLVVMIGVQALKVQWFAIFFLTFIIPLPNAFIAGLTLPMKMAVSYATEQILFIANYPVARNGVILHIGQYQLMVADACAGMQTLLTLEALGLLYININRRSSHFRNFWLAVFIVPISFCANVVRVLTLTLITYYFGDEVGQGFLHGFAGMLLFLIALVLIISLDSVLQMVSRSRKPEFIPTR